MTMAKGLHAELDGDQWHLGDVGSLVHLVDHQLACTSRRSKSRSTATAPTGSRPRANSSWRSCDRGSPRWRAWTSGG